MKLAKWFWYLLENCPVNFSVGTLGQPGLTHVDSTVQALIEVFHAFTTIESETIPHVSDLYAQFLVAENLQVSILLSKFSERKHALKTYEAKC